MTPQVSRHPRIRKKYQAGWSQFLDWFASNGWNPFPFQQQVWRAYLQGNSGLIHASTGTGKTYAAIGGALIEAASSTTPQEHNSKRTRKQKHAGCHVIWLTPLRALATDLAHAIERPLAELAPEWNVETRTGDTKPSIKTRQKKQLPEVLVTTPESLTLMLTRGDTQELLANLLCVVVDEWHELVGSKRGVQTELALARLRTWNPEIRTWGLSATIGNLTESAAVLMGIQTQPHESKPPKIVSGNVGKQYDLKTLIPAEIERFPWSGHLGLRQLPQVIEEIDASGTSLVFTNTRSQAEIWYQQILKSRPDWAGRMALHHGSIGQQTRGWVENGLREGTLKCVVCTSSLDLGVDFSPVEKVLQIGSPKGVARILQRAGRSGHRPGETSQVVCVPTNALELIEVAAARRAIAATQIESRPPLRKPLDVLTQHVCTVALGGGFEPEQLLAEVRKTWAYQDLELSEWSWVLDFVTTGGSALKAYPEYRRVEIDESGRYVLTSKRIARQHRLSIGTICSDGTIHVKFLRGGSLGSIEEAFVAKLKKGDVFTFAGKALEFVMMDNMTVWVRKAKQVAKAVPRWMGGRMPLSSELADAFLATVSAYEDASARAAERSLPLADLEPELVSVADILDIQQRWSYLPAADRLVIESSKTREGYHLHVYPLAGRLVHEGLSSLLAYRLSRRTPATFTFSCNDYGFELLSPTSIDLEMFQSQEIFSEANLLEDLHNCVNAAEMARRRFRDIAQISGLVFNGYPGQRRTARQLKASTGLLFDVFTNYDPENLLLSQAEREVFEDQLEHSRMVQVLRRLQHSELAIAHPPRFTPFAFPLYVDRLRQRLSNEKLQDRISRMTVTLERAAGSVFG